MSAGISCGEALMRLLERYGVDTIFGIPGYHTLDIYRGFSRTGIRHVVTRHEQGAGFMADGYARATGRPGVCVLISGPGVTNAATALGQSYADSVPVLLISSVNETRSLGKGWGNLHEITDQRAVTAPLTALSALAHSPDELPELFAQAFTIFASRRPRPVHISIPLDVLAMTVSTDWPAVTPPARPIPPPEAIGQAARLLATAARPVIVIGGGAVHAGRAAVALAEWLDASVIASNAGKGVVPDSHPLSLGGSMIRAEVREHLSRADVLLALGTELASTDSFVPTLPINGKIIRVDVDASKFNDRYPAACSVPGDARVAAEQMLAALECLAPQGPRKGTAETVSQVRRDLVAGLSEVERRHKVMHDHLRRALPEDAIIMGDISQVVYTGSALLPVERPRCWFYPAGFGTLGCALPGAIGARLGAPERPVVAIAGDGAFMFTMQELMTAVELKLPIPVILWDNDGFAMIRDGFDERGIPRVGASPAHPDFPKLADAFGCASVVPRSAAGFTAAVQQALCAPGPTLIVVAENAGWLQ
ncbi:MAG: 5-guanidino-2-oxopentanoate decarboxylase [Burkholderiaceae bacterium]|nr:5-guanidino-2-oxopentanoate decarboxylase [Burkholderiaceae bacterium]